MRVCMRVCMRVLRWGERATTATGLPVTRCHAYRIAFKHTWTCTGDPNSADPVDGVIGGG